jgi:predicted phosphodiesterase
MWTRSSSLLEPLEMDHIAIISDLHGNLPALEAVLRDIKRRNIARIFCLGDLVGKGPHSEKVVDICQDVCEVTIKGNWDDYILRDTEKPTMRWYQQRLGPERLAYLRQLPQTIEFWMSGRRVRLFHASQESVYYRVHMDDPRDKHLAMFTNTAFTGDTVEPDVVGYGDILRAFVMHFH